uniref:Uncharacterized protein n=1 Tax=Timema cristinae TaxID=61476 RepID=A0A7R9CEY5_TIMCR|nr:unnamed protein product [Timema cristinae]
MLLWCPGGQTPAASSGVDGQGSLSERMSLKERLEEGCSIVDTPAPPGASLWLIRHFIGRLPDPLLRGEHWRQLVSECSVAIQHMHTAERTVCPVHKLIARYDHSSAGLLPSVEIGETSEVVFLVFKREGVKWLSLSSILKEEYLVLTALFNLVHDLSMDRKTGHLNWVAIKSLVQYFTPSLVTRPFIPGLTTEGDCHFHPMMLMTCYYWPEIHLWCYHLDHTSIISSILPSATTPPSKTSWSFHSEIKQHNQRETTMSDINLDVMCLEDSFKSHRENGVGQLMGLVNNSPYIFPHQTHTILEDIPKIEGCCSQEGHKHDGLYSRKDNREVETNTNHTIGKRTKTQGTQCGGRYPEKGRDSGLVYTLVHKKAETLVRDCSSQYEDNVSASEDERSRSKDLRKTICDDSKQQNSLRLGLSHMFAVDQLYKKYNSNADGSLCPVQRVKSADKINFHSTKTFVHANKDSKTPNSVTHYDQSEPEMYSPFSEDTKYFSLENLTINSPRSVPTCNSEGKQLFCVNQDHPNRKDKLLISPEEEDFELRIQQKSTIGLETSGNSGGVQIFSDLTESTGRLETSIKPEDDKMVAEFIESAQRLETLRMSKDDQTVTDFIESARLLETLRKTEGNQTVADFIERARLLETLRKTEGDQTIVDIIERARLLETSRKSVDSQHGRTVIIGQIGSSPITMMKRKRLGFVFVIESDPRPPCCHQQARKEGTDISVVGVVFGNPTSANGSKHFFPGDVIIACYVATLPPGFSLVTGASIFPSDLNFPSGYFHDDMGLATC